MGTRSNFYKNPSFSYNRDFDLSSALRNLKAYNVVTGSASLTDGEPSNGEKVERRKRRRDSEAPRGGSRGTMEDDQPMSHEEYVQKRRRETSAAQAYQELTPDVLGASSLGLNLVDYGSDGSTSEKDEEKETQICGDQTKKQNNLVKNRSEQRFPLPGEPVCLVCGKYGEYICDETDDDICSLECKAVLLRTLKLNEDQLSNKSPVTASAEFVSGPSVPEEEKDAWDYGRHRWSNRKSSLSTYLCTTCQRPGHLAEDCLVAAGQNKSTSIPKDLLGIYRRCEQIGKSSSAARCNECQSSFCLATCLDCSRVICDGDIWLVLSLWAVISLTSSVDFCKEKLLAWVAYGKIGHLDEHIRTNPSHRQYYSHKLKRLVKCSKATCKVTDISDLLACHYCFDKAFDKFYDMCTASWHRMNCLNAGAEDSACIVSGHPQRGKPVQISEFIF